MPLSDRARRLAVPLAAFLFGLAVLGAAAVITFAPPATQTAASTVGGPFRLVDHHGREITEAAFAGRPYLVFFGFTHCPDVCPTTLNDISEVLRAAGDRGRDIRAVFLTADPERDTPEVLRSYLSSFDDRIVGLTGDRVAVDAALKSFKAFARKTPTKDGDYTVDHTSAVYLMDGQNRFVRTFSLRRSPEEAAKDLLSVR